MHKQNKESPQHSQSQSEQEQQPLIDIISDDTKRNLWITALTILNIIVYYISSMLFIRRLDFVNILSGFTLFSLSLLLLYLEFYVPVGIHMYILFYTESLIGRTLCFFWFDVMCLQVSTIIGLTAIALTLLTVTASSITGTYKHKRIALYTIVTITNTIMQ